MVVLTDKELLYTGGMKNLTTKKFGRLTVIKLQEIKKYKSARNTQTKAYWLCRCDCGNTRIARGEHLTAGKILSCGCLNRERVLAKVTTHGLSKTPEYMTWARIRERTKGNYKYYEDIKRCEGWRKFKNFYADMGARPTPQHSIDRIDTLGHYSCGHCDECRRNNWPFNCRWATRSEQAHNKKSNHEMYKMYASMAPAPIVSYATFRVRLLICKWPTKEAAYTPKLKNQYGRSLKNKEAIV